MTEAKTEVVKLRVKRDRYEIGDTPVYHVFRGKQFLCSFRGVGARERAETFAAQHDPDNVA